MTLTLAPPRCQDEQRGTPPTQEAEILRLAEQHADPRRPQWHRHEPHAEQHQTGASRFVLAVIRKSRFGIQSRVAENLLRANGMCLTESRQINQMSAFVVLSRISMYQTACLSCESSFYYCEYLSIVSIVKKIAHSKV